jgi:hypothetical protein
MKTEIIISYQKINVCILFFSFFFLFSVAGYAQNAKEISLSAYPGFTLVNFEKALGYSDDDMEDWSEIHISAALRGFILSEKSIKFGAEVAWQRLYYAYYIVPYGPSPVYREFNVSTVSILVLGRYSFNNFFSTGGAGIHFFKDGVAPSVCLEAGYMINILENLKIPLSFRINPIFGSGTPIPFSIGAGVSYILK